MVTILFTFLISIVVIGFALYLWRRVPRRERHSLPPPRPVALFGGEDSDAPRRFLSATGEMARADDRRGAIRERAAEGRKDALREAHASGDAAFYDEVLDILIERAAASKERRLSLASYISRSDELRTNARLADALREEWRAAPEPATMARMLHVAALSDDPAAYRRAVEAAVEVWREGGLGPMPAEELRALAEGEYWVLSSSARTSGEGFVLKRALAGLRRELANLRGTA